MKAPQKGNPSSAQIPSVLHACTTLSDNLDDTVVSRNRKKKKGKSSSKNISQDGRQKLVKSGDDKSRSSIILDNVPGEDLSKHERSGVSEDKVDLSMAEICLNSTDCIPLPKEEEVILKSSDNLPVE